MIDVKKAKQLMQIVDAGWRALSDDEFFSIVDIFLGAVNRAEREVEEDVE